MSTWTALIVPAFSDVASQCRIVAREGDVANALREYRRDPSQWREVGIMNSKGELVCAENLGNLRAELNYALPLMAGLVFVFNVPEAA